MKLVLKEIVKSFGDKEVLRGASFTFQQGRIYGFPEKEYCCKAAG